VRPTGGLGAVCVRLLPAHEENEPALVRHDIEGKEFCLN
jgi:hypothetical protein